MKTLREVQGFGLLYSIYWGFFPYITVVSSLTGTPAPRTMSWEDSYAPLEIPEEQGSYLHVLI